MMKIYYTRSQAIISDEDAKEYDIVSLEDAKKIEKTFHVSTYPKETIYVMLEILESHGFKKVDRKNAERNNARRR